MSEAANSQIFEAEAKLSSVDGVTPPSNSARGGAFLTDVIAELGFADVQTIAEAEETARRSEQRLEQLLVETGILDEDQLARAVAERNGLDHVDLDRFPVDVAAAELVGRAAAERYRAVPIAFDQDGTIVVAVEDPLDTLGLSDIEVMTKSEVRRVIATPSAIRRVVEGLPEEPRADDRPDLVEGEPVADVEPVAEVEAVDSAPAPVAEEAVGEQVPEPAPLEVVPPQPEPEPIDWPAANGAPSDGATEPTPDPEPEPELPTPLAGEGLDELSSGLRALREEASLADELASTLGRRIEELEGAEDRAERLEAELTAARERITELEQRSTNVDAAVEDVRQATEQLGALRETLEAGVRGR